MNESSTIVIVNGATGQMGSRVCALARNDGTFNVVARVAHAGSRAFAHPDAQSATKHDPYEKPLRTPHDLGSLTHKPDVVIDFSSDAGALDALALALRFDAALLVGTTALTAQTLEKLRAASKKISVLIASNTSLGVAAMAIAVRNLASALGPAYAVSIAETHHTRKKDAPSGTALRLLRALAEVGRVVPASEIVSRRVGDVVGDHTVRFENADERIEITHHAVSRDLFARGALVAGAWLKGKGPGWWTIEDVLGINKQR